MTRERLTIDCSQIFVDISCGHGHHVDIGDVTSEKSGNNRTCYPLSSGQKASHPSICVGKAQEDCSNIHSLCGEQQNCSFSVDLSNQEEKRLVINYKCQEGNVLKNRISLFE